MQKPTWGIQVGLGELELVGWAYYITSFWTWGSGGREREDPFKV